MNIGPATRALNSPFMVDSGHDSYVVYSVDIACTLNLSGGETGTVFLEIADDSEFTQNITEVSRAVNGNAGTLSLGLNITQTATGQVSGIIPAASTARIRTANTSGSPTFTYRSGQEATGV